MAAEALSIAGGGGWVDRSGVGGGAGTGAGWSRPSRRGSGRGQGHGQGHGPGRNGWHKTSVASSPSFSSSRSVSTTPHLTGGAVVAAAGSMLLYSAPIPPYLESLLKGWGNNDSVKIDTNVANAGGRDGDKQDGEGRGGIAGAEWQRLCQQVGGASGSAAEAVSGEDGRDAVAVVAPVQQQRTLMPTVTPTPTTAEAGKVDEAVVIPETFASTSAAAAGQSRKRGRPGAGPGPFIILSDAKAFFAKTKTIASASSLGRRINQHASAFSSSTSFCGGVGPGFGFARAAAPAGTGGGGSAVCGADGVSTSASCSVSSSGSGLGGFHDGGQGCEPLPYFPPLFPGTMWNTDGPTPRLLSSIPCVGAGNVVLGAPVADLSDQILLPPSSLSSSPGVPSSSPLPASVSAWWAKKKKDPAAAVALSTPSHQSQGQDQSQNQMYQHQNRNPIPPPPPDGSTMDLMFDLGSPTALADMMSSSPTDDDGMMGMPVDLVSPSDLADLENMATACGSQDDELDLGGGGGGGGGGDMAGMEGICPLGVEARGEASATAPPAALISVAAAASPADVGDKNANANDDYGLLGPGLLAASSDEINMTVSLLATPCPSTTVVSAMSYLHGIHSGGRSVSHSGHGGGSGFCCPPPPYGPEEADEVQHRSSNRGGGTADLQLGAMLLCIKKRRGGGTGVAGGMAGGVVRGNEIFYLPSCSSRGGRSGVPSAASFLRCVGVGGGGGTRNPSSMTLLPGMAMTTIMVTGKADQRWTASAANASVNVNLPGGHGQQHTSRLKKKSKKRERERERRGQQRTAEVAAIASASAHSAATLYPALSSPMAVLSMSPPAAAAAAGTYGSPAVGYGGNDSMPFASSMSSSLSQHQQQQQRTMMTRGEPRFGAAGVGNVGMRSLSGHGSARGLLLPPAGSRRGGSGGLGGSDVGAGVGGGALVAAAGGRTMTAAAVASWVAAGILREALEARLASSSLKGGKVSVSVLPMALTPLSSLTHEVTTVATAEGGKGSGSGGRSGRLVDFGPFGTGPCRVPTVTSLASEALGLDTFADAVAVRADRMNGPVTLAALYSSSSVAVDRTPTKWTHWRGGTMASIASTSTTMTPPSGAGGGGGGKFLSPSPSSSSRRRTGISLPMGVKLPKPVQHAPPPSSCRKGVGGTADPEKIAVKASGGGGSRGGTLQTVSLTPRWSPQDDAVLTALGQTLGFNPHLLSRVVSLSSATTALLSGSVSAGIIVGAPMGWTSGRNDFRTEVRCAGECEGRMGVLGLRSRSKLLGAEKVLTMDVEDRITGTAEERHALCLVIAPRRRRGGDRPAEPTLLLRYSNPFSDLDLNPNQTLSGNEVDAGEKEQQRKILSKVATTASGLTTPLVRRKLLGRKLLFLKKAALKKQRYPVIVPGHTGAVTDTATALPTVPSHPSHSQSVESAVASAFGGGGAGAGNSATVAAARREMWPLQYLDLADKRRAAARAAMTGAGITASGTGTNVAQIQSGSSSSSGMVGVGQQGVATVPFTPTTTSASMSSSSSSSQSTVALAPGAVIGTRQSKPPQQQQQQHRQRSAYGHAQQQQQPRHSSSLQVTQHRQGGPHQQQQQPKPSAAAPAYVAPQPQRHQHQQQYAISQPGSSSVTAALASSPAPLLHAPRSSASATLHSTARSTPTLSVAPAASTALCPSHYADAGPVQQIPRQAPPTPMLSGGMLAPSAPVQPMRQTKMPLTAAAAVGGGGSGVQRQQSPHLLPTMTAAATSGGLTSQQVRQPPPTSMAASSYQQQHGQQQGQQHQHQTHHQHQSQR